MVSASPPGNHWQHRYQTHFQYYTLIYSILIVTVTSIGRATFSYSAIQPPFDINFHQSLGYIRKQASWSPWGNYLTPGFVCSQYKLRPGITNLHRRHRPFMVPVHILVECSLGDSFLVPREIHVRSMYMYSCQLPSLQPTNDTFLQSDKTINFRSLSDMVD